MCANWFKRFKNDNFDISDKKLFDHPPAVEEDELRKDGKSRKMKILQLIYIVSIFLL